MKKLLLLIGAVAIALATVPMFAAFEAHVINVTAEIENALFIHPESRDFGTVFPQEYRELGVFVSFSESFSATDQTRVGTVEYVIKQKPKPRPEPDRPLPILKPDYNQYLPGGQFAGQLYPHFIDNELQRAEYCHTHQPADPANPDDLYYINCYPTLCPYLSKTPDGFPQPSNDTGVPALHDPTATSSWAFGKINKFGIDVADTWVIDLAVPCFEDQCAQDWDDFVHGINPAADPDAFVLPQSLEHEVFGCDLWFEVTDIY